MKQFRFAAIWLCLICAVTVNAQSKLSIDKVYKAYLRNSGAIVEGNQIKGYFLFYQSDKIDRKTNEYTLQILDQNLNKVKDMKFNDDKDVQLLEAAYNGNAIGFLFYNKEQMTTELKVYSVTDGKMKYSYVKDIDKKTKKLWETLKNIGMADSDEEGGNSYLFDIENLGFTTVLPLRDGRNKTYQVDYYGSENKQQWSYVPADEERWAFPTYLGATDSLLVLEVMKKKSQFSSDASTTILALNFQTKKVQYEFDDEKDEYTFMPMNLIKLRNTSNLLLMGSFYNKKDNVMTDFSKGIAMYEITSSGKIVNKKYNTWTEDMRKFLPINDKGKIDNVGFLYTHKLVQTPNGKIFAVCEGYKRNANAAGIALTMLAAAGGGYANAGMTKMVVTDMVVMEFDPSFKVVNAVIFDKKDNTALAGATSDYNSQHAIAFYLKNMGSFDYAFTTADKDYETFSFCYNDYERSKDYKGQTFNAIRYNGEKLTTDKIQLTSKATSLRVFPAKPGFVMIMEYFKKDKRIDMRMEKLN